jgi:uncharacterized Zn-finger protein
MATACYADFFSYNNNLDKSISAMYSNNHHGSYNPSSEEYANYNQMYPTPQMQQYAPIYVQAQSPHLYMMQGGSNMMSGDSISNPQIKAESNINSFQIPQMNMESNRNPYYTTSTSTSTSTSMGYPFPYQADSMVQSPACNLSASFTNQPSSLKTSNNVRSNSTVAVPVSVPSLGEYPIQYPAYPSSQDMFAPDGRNPYSGQKLVQPSIEVQRPWPTQQQTQQASHNTNEVTRQQVKNLILSAKTSSSSTGKRRPRVKKDLREDDAEFLCDFCGKTFAKNYNLKSHLKTHSDAKPFKCSFCERSFARNHDKKRHEYLHQGVKRFQCGGTLKDGVTRWGCGKHFSRADGLGRHFRTDIGWLCIRPLMMEAKESERLSGSEFPEQDQIDEGFLNNILKNTG